MTDPQIEDGLIIERGGELAELDLERFEADRGVGLPADYRSFLLAGDGAVFCDHNRFAETKVSGIDILFAVKDEAIGSFSLAEINDVLAGRVPADFLTIGRDWVGNMICLGVHGDHTGQVWWWDHERESDEDEPPTTDNLTMLAESFAHFIAGLHQTEG